MASLAAKTGVLGHRLAAHLLRRTTYHLTKALIDEYAGKTVTQAMDDLLTSQALFVPIPIDAATGLPWIDPVTGLRYTEAPNAPTSSSGILRTYMRGWWLDEARRDQTIHHKMEFFLHSIWVVDGSEGSPEEYWDYLRLLRHYALGSFKELAKKMTLDNQMLRYLDNNANNNANPNENYAREFLELFTIGKGPQIGEGDYTNYQELDVSEGARALTGWKNGNRSVYIDPDTNIPRGRPVFNQHDQTDKTFSTAFQSQTITGAVDANDMYRELDDYVDMVFAQDETARTICRRIYQFFVSRDISQEIETDIINPLADTLRNNDYVLEHALRQLFSSVHFYDEDDSNTDDEIIGAMMKSPIELTMHALNYFQLTIPDPVTDSYQHYHRFYKRCFLDCFGIQSGMNILKPANVAGYPAYYQEPSYQRLWFNSSTIVSRYKLPEQLIRGKRVILGGDLGSVKLEVVPFIANSGFFTDPGDASLLVTELADYLFCEMPDSDRIQYFTDVLTGDFDAAYWANLWLYYSGSYDEGEVKTPLEGLIKAMLYAPEFQLM